MNLFDKFILFIIGIYLVIFSVISVNRYWQYQTFYIDFGIYDDAIWKIAHFKAPIVDKGLNGRLNLGDHFTPGMYLLAPIYWVTDSQEAMFVAQVLAVCIAAWIAYLLIKSRTSNRFVQTALIVSFLGFVGMQNALITEMHEITFAVLPLMLVIWSIEKKKWKQYFIYLLLFLSFKENMAGIVIGLGIYLLIRFKKQYLTQAIASIVIGFTWGALTTMVVIPALNGGVYAYAPSFLKGQNIIEILGRFFSDKIKIETIFYTYSSFGFLPLFDISTWPLVFEQYFERFVLSNAPSRNNLGLHYNAILVPIMLMGTLNVITSLKKWIPEKIFSIFGTCLIIWVLIYSRFIYHGPIDLVFNKAFYEQRKSVIYQDDFVKLFPKKGLVLTQNDLGSRLTHGPDVRLIRKDFAYLNPDYVILNLTPGQNPNSYYPASLDIAIAVRDYYLADKNYTLTKVHDEQYLFAKKSLP
jgi:uncharacterized membrane protein